MGFVKLDLSGRPARDGRDRVIVHIQAADDPALLCILQKLGLLPDMWNLNRKGVESSLRSSEAGCSGIGPAQGLTVNQRHTCTVRDLTISLLHPASPIQGRHEMTAPADGSGPQALSCKNRKE